MENKDFFDNLEEDNKTRTDKEIEEMSKVLGQAFYNSNEDDKKNIYQIVSIILGVLGVIGSFIISVGMENITILFIGSFTSIVSALFMYGFGTIIKDLGKTRKATELIYNQLKKIKKY